LWQQNRDVQQVSWSGPTDIKCHPTKFIRMGDQAPRTFAPIRLCSLYYDAIECKEINWENLSSAL
jgi:hypothetical protein